MREYIKPETVKIDGETYIKAKDLISIIETHKDNMNERSSESGSGERSGKFKAALLDAYSEAHDNIIGLFTHLLI